MAINAVNAIRDDFMLHNKVRVPTIKRSSFPALYFKVLFTNSLKTQVSNYQNYFFGQCRVTTPTTSQILKLPDVQNSQINRIEITVNNLTSKVSQITCHLPLAS